MSADVAFVAGDERVVDPLAYGRRIGREGMSPMVNHLASLVSTWSPPGLPYSGLAWKHTANGWRARPVRGSVMTWPGRCRYRPGR